MQFFRSQKHPFYAALICFFLMNLSITLYAAPKTVLIKNTTNGVDKKIEYPQGFSNPNIDSTIQDFIKNIQRSNCPFDTENSTPGKNSRKNLTQAQQQKHDLYIDYEIKYQKNETLSLLFNLSCYVKRAAHPCNTVRTFNFIKAKPLQLAELFIPKTEYLEKIATFSRNELLKKDISTPEWITSGTKPIQENYARWYLTPEGLAIVFDTYQVAAYVYGPQTVVIPKEVLKTVLRPDITTLIWN